MLKLGTEEYPGQDWRSLCPGSRPRADTQPLDLRLLDCQGPLAGHSSPFWPCWAAAPGLTVWGTPLFRGVLSQGLFCPQHSLPHTLAHLQRPKHSRICLPAGALGGRSCSEDGRGQWVVRKSVPSQCPNPTVPASQLETLLSLAWSFCLAPCPQSPPHTSYHCSAPLTPVEVRWLQTHPRSHPCCPPHRVSGSVTLPPGS